jgi:DDE superfamily endonuclease
VSASEVRVPRPSHSQKKPGAEQEFQETLGEKLVALGREPGSRVKVWIMDEARFGRHTELRRVWTARGQRSVVRRQIKYRWDYLDGARSLLGGETHFAHVPGVGLEWAESYLRDLVATAPALPHVLVRDQAGFPLRDGDPRLPAPVRIIDLPPYGPELNPGEQFWDILKDDLANHVFPRIQKRRAARQDTLRRYWEHASTVLSLSGRDWFRVQLNASPKSHMSF